METFYRVKVEGEQYKYFNTHAGAAAYRDLAVINGARYTKVCKINVDEQDKNTIKKIKLQIKHDNELEE